MTTQTNPVGRQVGAERAKLALVLEPEHLVLEPESLVLDDESLVLEPEEPRSW